MRKSLDKRNDYHCKFTKNYIIVTKKGIKKARENGHLIFLCTGRNRVGIESIMSDDFDGCICSAGGYLEIKGEMIETTYLDKEEVEQARRVFQLIKIVRLPDVRTSTLPVNGSYTTF